MNLAEVRRLRSEGMSLFEAKHTVKQQELWSAVNRAETVADLRPVLMDLIHYTRFHYTPRD